MSRVRNEHYLAYNRTSSCHACATPRAGGMGSIEHRVRRKTINPIGCADGVTVIEPRKGSKPPDFSLRSGGAEGSRTPDLLIANETLYQLSYDPIQFIKPLTTNIW
jgi:hypothetical protein